MTATRRSAKRANGEGSITFDADAKRYVGRLTVGRDERGRPIRKKYVGPTRTAVLKRMNEARNALDNGLLVPDENLTVSTWLGRWLALLPDTVSPGTEDTYRRVVRLYLLPAIGQVRLSQVTPAHVETLLAGLQARGLSAETRRMARAVLRRALRRAEQEGTVARNVAAIAEGIRLDRKEQRCLSSADARRLLDAAADHRLHAAIVVMLGLGLRKGETLGLAWDSLILDADKPLMSIRRQLQRVPGKGLALVDLKTTKSRRDVAVPAFVVDARRAHRKRQAEERLRLGADWADEWGLVFTTPKGTPVDGRNLQRVLSSVAVEAGLGHRNPHELRHSAVSIMLAEGVPLEVVSEVVGHSSIRVTKDVYGHLTPGAKATAAEAMDRALTG